MPINTERHAAAERRDVSGNVIPENHQSVFNLPLEDRRQRVITPEAAVAHDLEDGEVLGR
jgi:hypothetical protein